MTSSGDVMMQNSFWALRNLFGTPEKEDHVISFSRTEAEQNEVVFDEEAQARPESIRKRVLPESAIGWTENCVVLGQRNLPDYLFTDFSLVDGRGRLLTEFKYTESEDGQHSKGRIYYRGEKPTEGEKTKWVHLITKNSCWNDLLWALTKGMLFSMTEYSHFQFIVAMDHNQGLFLAMICCLFLAYIARIGAAWSSATKEWAIDEGDIIQRSLWREPSDGASMPQPKNLRKFDIYRAFAALFMFNMLGITGLLRDITKYLHSWKGVQPFAAFKADGARGFLLGFPSAALFRIENRPHAQLRYILTGLQALVLTLLKMYAILMRWDQRNDAANATNTTRVSTGPAPDPAPSTNTTGQIHSGSELNWDIFLDVRTLPGLITCIANFWGAYRLHKDKSHVKKWLYEQIHHEDPKEQQVAQRLLKKHFNITFSVHPPEDSAGITSSTPLAGSRPKAQKHGMDRCAELARELQLWQKRINIEDELERRGIHASDVDDFLWSLRSIGRSSSVNERSRGPPIPARYLRQSSSPNEKQS